MLSCQPLVCKPSYTHCGNGSVPILSCILNTLPNGVTAGWVSSLFPVSDIVFLSLQGMGIIEQLDPTSFTNYLKKYRNTICGRHPIGVLLNVSATTRTASLGVIATVIISTFTHWITETACAFQAVEHLKHAVVFRAHCFSRWLWRWVTKEPSKLGQEFLWITLWRQFVWVI